MGELLGRAFPRGHRLLFEPARRPAAHRDHRRERAPASGPSHALEQRASTDPSWISTLDSLRVPRRIDQKIPDWRRDAPIRPVVFEDTGRLDEQTVHLHLEQRVVQRLLARFRAQGFIYHDLSRACLAQSRDPIPRVVLLGRLSLYGRGAERLHEQIVPVAARWRDPERRSGPLRAYARDAQELTMRLLDESLDSRARQPSEPVRRRLLAGAGQDIADLRPQLEPRAREFAVNCGTPTRRAR